MPGSIRDVLEVDADRTPNGWFCGALVVVCLDDLRAVIDGARAIAAGDADLVIAGGVESMTRAPLVMPKAREGFPRGDVTVHDSTLGWWFVFTRMVVFFGLFVL